MRIAPVLLALCLCVSLVSAAAHHDDMTDANCGSAPGVVGGYSPIDSAVAEDVLSAVLTQVERTYGSNITELIGNSNLCSANETEFTATGCSQVVAGTNYKLWINMSCTVGDNDYTVGVHVHAFEPLPSAADNSIQVSDVDVLFVTVNGEMINEADAWDHTADDGHDHTDDGHGMDMNTSMDDGMMGSGSGMMGTAFGTDNNSATDTSGTTGTSNTDGTSNTTDTTENDNGSN